MRTEEKTVDGVSIDDIENQASNRRRQVQLIAQSIDPEAWRHPVNQARQTEAHIAAWRVVETLRNNGDLMPYPVKLGYSLRRLEEAVFLEP